MNNIIRRYGLPILVIRNLSLETKDHEFLIEAPVGRWGLPEDLAGALIFLLLKASDNIHRVFLPVDGGFLVPDPNLSPADRTD